MSDQFSAPYAPPAPPAKKTNPWIIILIVVAVILLLCCCCLVVFGLLGPSLLGPDVGNIFSNIQQGLMTPVP